MNILKENLINYQRRITYSWLVCCVGTIGIRPRSYPSLQLLGECAAARRMTPPHWAWRELCALSQKLLLLPIVRYVRETSVLTVQSRS